MPAWIDDLYARLGKLGVDTSLGPVAICEFCDWTAQHRGHPATEAEAVEIVTLLRSRCIEHQKEQHGKTV
jgi:hypothetical protein